MLSVLLPWWHPIKRFSQPKDYNKGPLSCWETATIWSSFLWSYINSEALKTFFFIYIVIARASYNEAHMLGRAAACNAKPTKSPGTTTPLLKIHFGIGIYSISSDTTLRLGTEGWTFSKRQPRTFCHPILKKNTDLSVKCKACLLTGNQQNISLLFNIKRQKDIWQITRLSCTWTGV